MLCVVLLFIKGVLYLSKELGIFFTQKFISVVLVFFNYSHCQLHWQQLIFNGGGNIHQYS